MATVVPTAHLLLVFGRGVSSAPDGWALTQGSAARVRAAVDYVAAHAASFRAAAARGRIPRIVFTGGWAEACAGADEPPPGCREGDLMLRRARAAGLDRYAELHAESRSRSTLENLLHTAADGLLAGHTGTAEHPLGLVSHAWHLPRVRYLAGKVLGWSGPALLDVPATEPGEPAPWLSQRVLHAASRVCFLGAADPARLLRRERRLVAAMRLTRPIG